MDHRPANLHAVVWIGGLLGMVLGGAAGVTIAALTIHGAQRPARHPAPAVTVSQPVVNLYPTVTKTVTAPPRSR